MYYELTREKTTSTIDGFVGHCSDFPMHFHNCFEMLYVENGKMSIDLLSNKYNLSTGELLLIPPNTPHSFTDCLDNKTHLIFIATFYIDEIGTIFKTKTLTNLKLKLTQTQIKNVMDPFISLVYTDKNPLSKKGLTYQIFDMFLEQSTLVITENSINSDIAFRILRIIQKNFDTDISISSIAKTLSICPTYVSRVFNNNIGCNFKGYINTMRVEKSKKLLFSSDDSIVDIAVECGYDSQRSFNRAFKQITGITPGEYRSQNKL